MSDAPSPTDPGPTDPGPTDPQPQVDCDAGRRLGCGTFCCRLIVRLEPEEPVPGRTPAGTLAKDPQDGCCVHLDRQTGGCTIYEARPAICRSYDCNRDPLLQVVIRDSYSDLVEFQLRAAPAPSAPKVRVPYRTGS